MGEILLHRVAVVRPFTEYLTDSGVSIECAFQRVGLPVTALEDANNYIPSQRFHAFIVDVMRREGIEDLGFLVGRRRGVNCIDPNLAKQLRHSPTLYQGILRFSKLANETVSNSHMGLLQPPLSPHAYFYHRPSCGDRHPAVEQIGWYGLTIMIQVVRAFAGRAWQPTEIGVIQHYEPCDHIREQFRHARIRLSQQQNYISVENAALSLTPFGQETTAAAFSPQNYETYSSGFASALKQLMLSYALEKTLTMAFVADLCNMSTRSLHRKLAACGTRYSEVLDQVHFHGACQMLVDPSTKVTDVAHTLGYGDASHFSRAFRRIAGVSPTQYRQQIHH